MDCVGISIGYWLVLWRTIIIGSIINGSIIIVARQICVVLLSVVPIIIILRWPDWQLTDTFYSLKEKRLWPIGNYYYSIDDVYSSDDTKYWRTVFNWRIDAVLVLMCYLLRWPDRGSNYYWLHDILLTHSISLWRLIPPAQLWLDGNGPGLDWPGLLQ